MPDWITHIVIALLFAEVFNIKRKSVILIGAILPDLLPKLVLLQLLFPIPNWNYGLLKAFHVPFISFLTILLIAPIFRYNYVKIVSWLSLGALTHFLADATLKHFKGGVPLLYPVSAKLYALNLIWPDESYLILIPAVLLYVFVLFIKSILRRT